MSNARQTKGKKMKTDNLTKEPPAACDHCATVPLSYLKFDLPAPVTGWESMLAGRGVEVVTDDLGRPAVPREVLGELIAENREQEARMAEQHRRRTEEARRKAPRVARGIPGIAGVDALAVMMGNDRDYR